MSVVPDGINISLSRKELISLYLVLMGSESNLDDTQREVFAQISDEVYRMLSIEEIEDINSYYLAM